MSQLLTDAVCGEDVPAWVESVDELDAEIKQCETLGWRSGTGFEWATDEIGVAPMLHAAAWSAR